MLPGTPEVTASRPSTTARHQAPAGLAGQLAEPDREPVTGDDRAMLVGGIDDLDKEHGQHARSTSPVSCERSEQQQ